MHDAKPCPTTPQAPSVLVPLSKPNLAVAHIKDSHHVRQERNAQRKRARSRIHDAHAAQPAGLDIPRVLPQQVVRAHVVRLAAHPDAERRHPRVAGGVVRPVVLEELRRRRERLEDCGCERYSHVRFSLVWE